MQEIWTYHITVQGQVGEHELNKMSPLEIAVLHENPASTLVEACSDQSGLIGLMRHLHGCGFIFLSITREQ